VFACVDIDGSMSSIATDPNNGLTPCQLFSPLPLNFGRDRGCKISIFCIGVCQGSKTQAGDATPLCPGYDFKGTYGRKAYV
jgi:hypothetical protein